MLKQIYLTLSALTAIVTLSSCSNPQPEASPSIVTLSVDPKNGQGSTGMFSIKARSTSQIKEIRLMINTDIDGRNACYVYFSSDQKAFSLVNDSGEGSKILPLGNAGKVENSQCAISGNKSETLDGQGGINVNIALEFLPGFLGKKQVFAYAQDTTGANTGIQKQGDWNVLAK